MSAQSSSIKRTEQLAAAAAGKIDQILERIGLQDTAGPARVEALPQGPSREYPPLPERSIKFGELLTKCGYEQEVLDQYSDALDVEVRAYLPP